jgi:hypothetical protein
VVGADDGGGLERRNLVGGVISRIADLLPRRTKVTLDLGLCWWSRVSSTASKAGVVDGMV